MTGDPTSRFTDRVGAYVRGRPGYPPAVLDLMRDALGLGPGTAVADVGSGTGILTKLLLAAGATVHAVEPNAEMRAAAEAMLSDEPGFVSVDGRAEATGLADASVDLLTAAQAFHWFDPAAFGREARRILRPGGRAALLWNRRRPDGTPFLRAYEAFLRRWGTDYREVRTTWAGQAALEVFFGPGGYERRAFPNHQLLDRGGLVDRTRSSSYIPREGHPDHEGMLRALDALFDEHAEGGVVRMEYDTEVYVGPGRKVARFSTPPGPRGA